MQNACNQTLCAQAVHGITVQEGAHKRREGDLQGVPGRREAQAAAQQSEMAAFLYKESKGVGRYMYTGTPDGKKRSVRGTERMCGCAPRAGQGASMA